MDRRAWWAPVHTVAQSPTQQNDLAHRETHFTGGDLNLRGEMFHFLFFLFGGGGTEGMERSLQDISSPAGD